MPNSWERINRPDAYYLEPGPPLAKTHRPAGSFGEFAV